MILGVTGHQDLAQFGQLHWIQRELESLVGNPNVEGGISCLAAGADQEFAEVLLRYGKDLLVIIPSKDYDDTFDTVELQERYRTLLSQAATRELLPNATPTEEAFFSAGKRVVELADTLVAVWDGLPAKGLGGTADVVAYGRNQGKPIIHINPSTKEVSRL